MLECLKLSGGRSGKTEKKRQYAGLTPFLDKLLGMHLTQPTATNGANTPLLDDFCHSMLCRLNEVNIQKEQCIPSRHAALEPALTAKLRAIYEPFEKLGLLNPERDW